MRAPEVLVTDVNPYRLSLAERLGLTALNAAETPIPEADYEADVLIECSGNPRATRDAVATLARAGCVVLVGMGGDEVTLPLSYIQDRELVVTGAFRYANTWPAAIGLAASGRVDLDGMVTGHFGLEQVEDALTAATHDPQSIKAIVRPTA